MMRASNVARLSRRIESDDPPTEFLIFVPGENTALGRDPYVFDTAAADSVMEAFAAHAVDIMIDLEHLSVDDKHPNYDPDARGYCSLEVRDGALWATNVRLSPDGAERIKLKKQRFISPTFTFDKDRRVREIFNIALTSNPALDGIPALAAANATFTEETNTMADEDNGAAIASILKAVGLDPKMPAKVAVALGLGADAPLEDIKAALDKFASMVAKAKELLATDPAEPAETSEPAEPAAETPAADAPATANAKLLAAVESMAARLNKQESDAAAKRLADERAALCSERAWPTELQDWLKDPATPIAELKRLAPKFPLATAAVPQDASVLTSQPGSSLDARELGICREVGCDPAVFAQLKARRDSDRKRVS